MSVRALMSRGVRRNIWKASWQARFLLVEVGVLHLGGPEKVMIVLSLTVLTGTFLSSAEIKRVHLILHPTASHPKPKNQRRGAKTPTLQLCGDREFCSVPASPVAPVFVQSQ